VHSRARRVRQRSGDVTPRGAGGAARFRPRGRGGAGCKAAPVRYKAGDTVLDVRGGKKRHAESIATATTHTTRTHLFNTYVHLVR